MQQAGLIVGLAAAPLVLELACRVRAVSQDEMAEFRQRMGAFEEDASAKVQALQEVGLLSHWNQAC